MFDFLQSQGNFSSKQNAITSLYIQDECYEKECLSEDLTVFYHFFYHCMTQNDFDLNPPGQMTVICFSNKSDLGKYTRQKERIDGIHFNSYYSTRTNRVIVLLETTEPGIFSENTNPARLYYNQMPETDPNHFSDINERNEEFRTRICHEFAHQLSFNTGLLSRGVRYPLWLIEGIAVYFETYRPGQKQVFKNAKRHKRLFELCENDCLAEIETLVTTTSVPRGRREKIDFYAQCWGLFQYLFENHPLRLKNYLNDIKNRSNNQLSHATAYRLFTKNFGDPDRVYLRWIQNICDSTPQNRQVIKVANK